MLNDITGCKQQNPEKLRTNNMVTEKKKKGRGKEIRTKPKERREPRN